VIIGALMVVLGNGLVIWSEQYIPSGVVAVMVAAGPFWLVLSDWWTNGRQRLGLSTIMGLLVGFLGVLSLTALGSDLSFSGDRDVAILSVLAILVATFSWASGSIYARRLDLNISLTMLLGLQMLAGSLVLVLAGSATGEWAKLDLSAVTMQSAASLIYLVVMGTLVGYSAYLWLMRVSEPAKVATHGYVNPVVAVLLGWSFAGEPLNLGMLVATGTILFGVALTAGKPLGIISRIKDRFSNPRLTDNPELAMIARTWQGVVPTEKADAYYAYLLETGVSAIKRTEGNRGVYVLRRDEDDSTRFMFISMWESLEAIKQFAGENPEAAVYFPKDREYLQDMVPCVEHYEVLGPVN
jgi:drug/metabolite transporter (DMT)-like permease/heme-degrading monooxygenase HmoA